MSDTKRYPHVGVSPARPPDFARVARALSPPELDAEIEQRRGSEAYRAALEAEKARRRRC